MSLPKFVVLKSNYNNKYLQYINENVKVHGFLKFSGDDATSPLAKLEVVPANNGLVHLRCCYNNKFLTEKHWWIVAEADHPVEDQSQWSCTLFKPVFVDGKPETLRFMHVLLGRYACLWRAEEPYNSCLYAGVQNVDGDQCDVCTFIDWEAMMANFVNTVQIEAWGGSGGGPWSFEVKGGGITKIIVQAGRNVVSIAFVGQPMNGEVQESAIFGCEEGLFTFEIVLDWPREYVTSISGTEGSLYGSHVIKSLEFATNLGNKHGPYGKGSDHDTSFNLSIKGGAVVGFHGRGGDFVDAIGVYVRPISTSTPQ